MRLIYLLAILISVNIAVAQWQPGDNLIDERDGQSYKTIKIGEQVWMAENLNIGNLIPTTQAGYEMSDNNIIEKYCWDNDEGNCNGSDGKMKRGGFYEWMEAMQYWTGQPENPHQGLCPKGWHIPTNAEFSELAEFLGGSSIAGGKLKVGGETGFNALLTGYRCTMTGSFSPGYTFSNSDWFSYFWTAEHYDAENSYFWEVNQNLPHFSMPSFQAFAKSLGLCVRCLWDGPASDIKKIPNQTVYSNWKLFLILLRLMGKLYINSMAWNLRMLLLRYLIC